MIRIQAARLLDDLQALARIGATEDGGVSRPAMSEIDLLGRAWFRDRAAQDGFTVQQDGAGNLSAGLRSQRAGAPTLLIGSHLDTVPDGGRYDGALGVLSALEVLRAVRDHHIDLPFHLEAISFTDEEGTILGLFGSLAASGQLTAHDFDQAAARVGMETLAAGLMRLGITPETALQARRADDLLGYVELHIEQGRRLERAGLRIGVVTAIVGIRAFWLHFKGEAAHAGTMPMADRKDALWGAAHFAQRARQVVMEQFTPGVMNCGLAHVSPGAFNIVPDQVRLALEFRHGADADLDHMQTVLLDLAQSVADEYGLTVEAVRAGGHHPAPMDAGLMTAIEAAADALDLSHTRLMSFAGHDAQAMCHIAPSAMLFVPSVAGISHNPREFTRDDDVVNGANVLLHTVLEMAKRAR